MRAYQLAAFITLLSAPLISCSGDQEVELVQSRVFSALLKCDDSYFGMMPDHISNRIIEIVKPEVLVEVVPISTADKANGIEWQAKFLVNAEVYRFYGTMSGRQKMIKPGDWMEAPMGVPLFRPSPASIGWRNFNAATIRDGELKLQYFAPYEYSGSVEAACDELSVGAVSGEKNSSLTGIWDATFTIIGVTNAPKTNLIINFDSGETELRATQNGQTMSRSGLVSAVTESPQGVNFQIDYVVGSRRQAVEYSVMIRGNKMSGDWSDGRSSGQIEATKK